jgi:hypothetical protein
MIVTVVSQGGLVAPRDDIVGVEDVQAMVAVAASPQEIKFSAREHDGQACLPGSPNVTLLVNVDPFGDDMAFNLAGPMAAVTEHYLGSEGLPSPDDPTLEAWSASMLV